MIHQSSESIVIKDMGISNRFHGITQNKRMLLTYGQIATAPLQGLFNGWFTILVFSYRYGKAMDFVPAQMPVENDTLRSSGMVI